MAKKDKKAKPETAKDNQRMIAENRKARHKYEILESLECGIVLRGSEVKSMRDGRVSLGESYARVKNNEVWLVGCDIAEYPNASMMNHEPLRPRKLLLHRREIEKFASKAYETGLTLVPLAMYFKDGKAKLLLGVGRGRKLHDKREKLKKETQTRDIQRAMRRE